MHCLYIKKTFPHEQELKELIKKQNELNLKMEFEEKIREKNNAQKVSDESQEASAEVIINIPSGNQENRVKNKALITERT